jgi:hypothetical protein
MGENPRRTPSLEKASHTATTTPHKIMATWTLWKTIDTLFLQNEHIIKKARPPKPFTTSMLIQIY